MSNRGSNYKGSDIMAQLTYDEFVNEYYPGGGHATNWLQGAYNKYIGRVSGNTSSSGSSSQYVGMTPEQIAYAEEHYPGTHIGVTPGYNPNAPGTWAEHLALLEAGGYPTEGLIEPGAIAPVAPTTPTVPTVPPITAPTIAMPPAPVPPAAPAVPTVPPYEPSPEQAALTGEYGEYLREWREAGGYGIPEEVQAQMIQRTTDTLKAREQESLRVMENNMERRSITNSGFVFASTMEIKANTTVNIANTIRDIGISSALMKLASFEKAMGATAQFIGYLAEESWKTYQPKMAQVELEAQYGLAEYGMAGQYGIAGYQAQVQGTMAQFQADALAIMTKWQAGFDLTKMELNQAYNQGNMELAGQIAEDAAAQQHIDNIQLMEMEIEVTQEMAKQEAAGSISGSIVTGLFAVGAAMVGVPV
jgi:hypothetical protein